jgi:type I site-specific restriction endonuclease
MSNIKLRSFQEQAVEVLLNSIKSGRDRMLFYQLVGTGRTVTILAATLELQKSGAFRKVLLLVEQKVILHQFLHMGREHFPDLDIVAPKTENFGFDTGFLQIM